jgi:predicted secreted protein
MPGTRSVLPLLIAFASVVGPARAEDDGTLFNRVYLEARAEREVANDEIIVVLVTRHQGKSPREIASRVNDDMAWALKWAQGAAGVRATTGAYTTTPVYEKGVIQAWEARQELQLRGTDIAAATALAGELQERLQIGAMQFQPTRALRERTVEELIDEALTAFRQRAGRIAAHMDGKEYRIVDLHVSTQDPGAPVVQMERAMKMMTTDAAPPAVEAGTSAVQVTVSGSVQYY